MTDQNAPDVTDEDRRLAHEWAKSIESRTEPWTEDTRAVVRVILDAVPTLPRPTLEDLPREERVACRWMQADVENRRVRYVITNPCDAEGDAALTSADGEIEWFSPERVTPRPDLPRMEWPGTEKPAPAPALPEGWRLADHQKYGRVIVTTQTPNRAWHVCFVIPSVGGDPLGFEWHTCSPSELTYLDQGADQ